MMLLLAAQSLYVGNNACAPCHAEIFRSYSDTPMARSSGRVASDVPAGSFRQESSGVEYRVDAGGRVEVSKGSDRVERRLDYFIGSGAAGRSYLYSRDGFLFQAPVTWYANQSRWDPSPGYQGDTASRWNRPIEPDCLNCHASQIRSDPASVNRYASPPFAQSGIGCERCHGPGSEHVAGRGRMVDPAKLPTAERDSVCAQCHMSGEARIERADRRLADFRPGDRLSDYVAFFVSDNAGPLRATGYVEKLAASRCKIASGDALWCGTCHDPHRVPSPAQRVAWFRAKCLTCHQTADCPHSAGDCASCHMLKSRVADAGSASGGHGVLTDHSIPRIPRPATNDDSGGWKLHPFAPADAGERELGLAYAQLALRDGNRNQAREAVRLLATAPLDPEIALRLAAIYQRQGDNRRALPLYESVLRKNPASMVALVNLGLYEAAAGNLDRAITRWKQALHLNPCAIEAGRNLEIAYRSRGDTESLSRLTQTQAGCVLK